MCQISMWSHGHTHQKNGTGRRKSKYRWGHFHDQYVDIESVQLLLFGSCCFMRRAQRANIRRSRPDILQTHTKLHPRRQDVSKRRELRPTTHGRSRVLLDGGVCQLLAR